METKGQRLRHLFVSANRVVETVQAVGGLVPVRQFRLLFPLWRIGISGHQYEKRPYELLERFLERAIGEAELQTVEELERFLGLPLSAVTSTLAFLRTVGHVSGDDEHLRLTDLGKASLQSGLFLRPLESQRLLYFEAFDSQPLPRSYYEHESLILSEGKAARLGDRTITRLYSGPQGLYFDPGRLWQLARQPDREQFNLPSELELGPDAIRQVARVYFPLTVVEAHAYDEHFQHVQGKRYLALSPIAGYRDHFFERLIQSKPAIAYSFPELDERRIPEVIERHASRLGLQLPGEARIIRSSAGLWQLVLSPRLFQAASAGERQPLRLSDLGNVRQEDGFFFQLWCADQRLRRRSALEQTLLFIEREQRKKQTLFRGSILHMLSHVCQRLQVPVADWSELEAFAREQEREDLLEELES
ncbi:MAG: hypothetical protein IRZ31_10730 [Thermogemmatispora sp.]|uniref:hypothetical protein n=1 Tax=Thermogemmatispora sp. TaxID=1968838 RepID=UPI00263681EC|nr:hypothetical protein [Thermogemmatispora sp.]MBX5457364.1 hypothetical protein [Thermogemmatispora sp.]